MPLYKPMKFICKVQNNSFNIMHVFAYLFTNSPFFFQQILNFMVKQKILIVNTLCFYRPESPVNSGNQPSNILFFKEIR